MILGYTKTEDLPATTLDDVFHRAARRRPGAFALADPTNRDSFTDGPSRHLTYAEADRVVSAIASRLRTLGLQTDAIIGIQLPNAVESVLTTLGVLRAGLIAVPLPLLWRRADMARDETRKLLANGYPHWVGKLADDLLPARKHAAKLRDEIMPRVADRTDVVAELQRAEIRAYVRSLPLTERTALALSLSAISWV